MVLMLIMAEVFKKSIYYDDNYRIIGKVSELGAFGSYRVNLFVRYTGICIRQVFSAPNGDYAFNNIAYIPNGYYVIAFDHGANPLNAAIADLITPEPMP